MSRMLQRLADGETTYGTYTILGQSEVVEIMGHLGMDYVIIDLMMGSVDWSRAATLALAADRYGMTPVIRLPSFPWSGADVVDQRLAADVLRAVTIGAQGVRVSLETPEQVAAALVPTRNDHRRVYLPTYELQAHGSAAEAAGSHAPEDRCLLIPIIESELAVQNLDDIMSVEGLEAIALGMGDLVRLLGHPNDFGHPEVMAFIEDVVVRARRHDVAVFANIHGRPTVPEQVEAARSLEAVGVRGISVAFDTAVLIRYWADLLGRLR